MSKCKVCGAEIKWIKTRKGKLMPVNVPPLEIVPARNGKRTYISDAGDVFHGDEKQDQTALLFDNQTVKGYEVHFGTCPKYRRDDR